MPETNASGVPEGVIDGRPDWGRGEYGVTTLKRHPPYVYSLRGGMLVHKLYEVRAHWYEPILLDREAWRTGLKRRKSPKLTFHTNCGQMFYGGAEMPGRSRTCKIPAKDAVLCGRCHGEAPTFAHGTVDLDAKRDQARARIGCVVEVE